MGDVMMVHQSDEKLEVLLLELFRIGLGVVDVEVGAVQYWQVQLWKSQGFVSCALQTVLWELFR